MDLARPDLLLLIPVAWAVLLLARRLRGRSATLRFSSSDLVSGLGVGWRVKLRPFLGFLPYLACAVLVVALAQPRVAHDKEVVKGEGIDIALVLDISGSMRALDFEPEDRLGVAKRTIEDFVEGREQDRISLVVFAARAFTQCPLTLDYDVLTGFLDEIEVGLIDDGTAIGLGIATGVKRLAQSEAESKVLILLTDGVNNVTTIDPLTAADAAAALGVKIYTIGVGKEGLAPYPVDHPILGRRYTQIETKIDEKLLQEVSNRTGGRYFRAQSGEGLEEIFGLIDDLEKTEIDSVIYTNYSSLAHWWILAGILLLLAESVLSASALRVLP
jgi:Ca-activated chloride channel family protein